MLKMKSLSALALVTTLLLPAVSLAEGQKKAPCVLHEHVVTSVTPYESKQQVGRGTVRHLRGAQVTVQAERGLTAEWLWLTIGRHLTEMRGPNGMADCALDVDDVRVEVDSSGAGFVVKLIANGTQAEEVLRRARLLLG